MSIFVEKQYDMEDINIESVLNEFKEHLRYNDRTILSARYGDGKTYFLDRFKEKFKDEYEFITLYPVNYQISENKEIFEYIKRDILIQMVMKNMISPDCDITEAHYLQHYILKNHLTLLQDIIQILPELGIGNEGFVWSALMAGFKGLSFLKSQKEKYDQFKKDIESQSDIELADKFCDSFSEQKGGCYELDLITEIIIQSLKKFKNEHPSKKTVLIIEDMDRLDPAHLFRLLNIFSAHLDRYNIYKNTSSLKEYVLSNKFGFDHIITVFDFDNAQKIFSHFYGKDANFEGYINKFTTGFAFRYSINEIARKNFAQLLKNECGIEIYNFKGSYPDIADHTNIYKAIQKLSVRDIQKITCKYKEGLNHKIHEFSTGRRIYTDNSLTKLISILKLVGIDNNEIKKGILFLPDLIKLNCIGCYMLENPDVLYGAFVHQGYYYSLRNNMNNGPVDRIEFIKLPERIGGIVIDNDQLVHYIDKAFEHIQN